MKKSVRSIVGIVFDIAITTWCVLELLTDNFGKGNPSYFWCISILVLNALYMLCWIMVKRKSKK